MRLRRSSKLMFYDPYTLTIVPGKCGRAEGSLYLDDENTFAHEEQGMYAVRKFIFTGKEIQSTMGKNVFYSINKGSSIVASPKFQMNNIVERIMITSQGKAPKKVILKQNGQEDKELSFFYDGKTQLLTIKKPATRVIDDWTIVFDF
jgi:alpha 1,3-glucosidase